MKAPVGFSWTVSVTFTQNEDSQSICLSCTSYTELFKVHEDVWVCFKTDLTDQQKQRGRQSVVSLVQPGCWELWFCFFWGRLQNSPFTAAATKRQEAAGCLCNGNSCAWVEKIQSGNESSASACVALGFTSDEALVSPTHIKYTSVDSCRFTQ